MGLEVCDLPSSIFTMFQRLLKLSFMRLTSAITSRGEVWPVASCGVHKKEKIVSHQLYSNSR